MSPDDPTIVHPIQLRRVATMVDDAAKLISGVYEQHKAELQPPSGQGSTGGQGPGGWSTIAAASSAATRWGGFLPRLASTVTGVATSMTAAADGYTAADANAARLLDKAR